MPVSEVIGVEDAMLAPDFWIKRAERCRPHRARRQGDRGRKRALLQKDPTLHDLQALPATLTRKQVTDVDQRHVRTSIRKPMYDADSAELSASHVDALIANVATSSSVAEQTACTLRHWSSIAPTCARFPATLRAYSSAERHVNIDRFQESALFPGTPVVIAHASRDGNWRFVVSPRYAAWVEKRFHRRGSGGRRCSATPTPRRRTCVVTGATVKTVLYAGAQPAVSELQLDMGVRVPVLSRTGPRQNP